MNAFFWVVLPVCVFAVEVVVHTDIGDIIGKQTHTPNGRNLYYFLGVPYAKSPVGKRRFMEPQPITKRFEKPYKAIATFRCWQYLVSKNVVTGIENCLHLNIHTTSLSKQANLPVLVFIHGGGFFYGAGHEYSPDYLLEGNRSLTFVTINYRVGFFGFLSTEDCVMPGNNGLKDQVMALEWIKKHIRAFGGDPGKVILSGMSAGGVSVHFHYLSPMSQHLFSHGISMSGTALSSLTQTRNARQNAIALGKLMKCPTENSTALVDCLREKDGSELLKALYTQILPWERYNTYVHFGPVIENCGERPFLNEHPYYIMRQGKVKNAPWLASAVTGEGLKPAAFFIDKEERLKELNEHWESIAPHLLVFTESASEEVQTEVSRRMWKEYLGDAPLTKDNRDKLTKLIGDRLYMVSIENAVRLHAASSRAPVYYYMFDYRGKISFSTIFGGSPADLGVSHVDDLIYILKLSKMDTRNIPRDYEMVKVMRNIWWSFILKMAPEIADRPSWPHIARHVVYSGNLNYMLIRSPKQIHVVSTPDISRREFWDSLPLDELHVAGNRFIPNHIKAQQGWVSRVFGTTTGKTMNWFSGKVYKPISKAIEPITSSTRWFLFGITAPLRNRFSHNHQPVKDAEVVTVQKKSDPRYGIPTTAAVLNYLSSKTGRKPEVIE